MSGSEQVRRLNDAQSQGMPSALADIRERIDGLVGVGRVSRVGEIAEPNLEEESPVSFDHIPGIVVERNTIYVASPQPLKSEDDIWDFYREIGNTLRTSRAGLGSSGPIRGDNRIGRYAESYEVVGAKTEETITRTTNVTIYEDDVTTFLSERQQPIRRVDEFDLSRITIVNFSPNLEIAQLEYGREKGDISLEDHAEKLEELLKPEKKSRFSMFRNRSS